MCNFEYVLSAKHILIIATKKKTGFMHLHLEGQIHNFLKDVMGGNNTCKNTCIKESSTDFFLIKKKKIRKEIFFKE